MILLLQKCQAFEVQIWSLQHRDLRGRKPLKLDFIWSGAVNFTVRWAVRFSVGRLLSVIHHAIVHPVKVLIQLFFFFYRASSVCRTFDMPRRESIVVSDVRLV